MLVLTVLAPARVRRCPRPRRRMAGAASTSASTGPSTRASGLPRWADRGTKRNTSDPTPLPPRAPASVASPEARRSRQARASSPPSHSLVHPNRSLQPLPDGRPSPAACPGGGAGPAHARCASFFGANLTFPSSFRH